MSPDTSSNAPTPGVCGSSSDHQQDVGGTVGGMKLPASRPSRSEGPARTQPRPGAAASGPAPTTTRMFALTVPGLGGLLRDQIDSVRGLAATAVGNDGRSDVVLFDADRGHQAVGLGLSLAEDVFVEIGRTLRGHGDRPDWIASRIWKPRRAERALSVRTATGQPLPAKASFRVIVRVLNERSFLRTDLRRAVTAAVQRDRPRWRVTDPAQLELWVVEYRRSRIVAGLRLSDERMRQHGGRVEQRRGALRPTVAAAMVEQAGKGLGVLLDPCCGSGTILAEALAHGWRAIGRDIDPGAVKAALSNAPDAEIAEGDARHLDLADASVGAVVTNLPFGRQFKVGASMDDWLRQVTAELARVTLPTCRVVLLAPNIPKHVTPPVLRLVNRIRLRLLGMSTSIWTYERLG